MFSDEDLLFMRHALEEAKKCSVLTSPNPKVGCVIVKKNQIIGKGFTQIAGQNHAEIQALQNAAHNGVDVTGATLYVTLEPCSHTGKTPPCVDKIIDSGIARVVASCVDPNPLVSGEGFRRLKDANIQVDVGLLEKETRQLNAGFFSRMEKGRPFVRLKMASSLNGKAALANGKSQWITHESARRDVHNWRGKADVIITGIGTVLADNPQMNVRLANVSHQPIRIILDSSLRTPLDATILNSGKTWIFSVNASPEKIKALESKGVRVINNNQNQTGRVDLADVMVELAKESINEVYVEAGPILSGAMLQAGFVDEVLLYLAPSFIGGGKDMASLKEMHSLSESIHMRFTSVTTIGEDIRVIAEVVK